jgi:hypothetical protein
VVAVSFARATVDGAGAITVALAELVSSGAGVLAVCADASRRAPLASGATGLARFNGGAARIACHRCGGGALAALTARAGGGLALTDYAALAREPALAEAFEHVVMIDPPRGRADEDRCGRASGDAEPGYLHRLWTPAEQAFAVSASDEQWASRAVVGGVFRRLREAGEVSGRELRQALAGGAGHPLCPETAARCLRVLSELGLVAGEANGGAGVVGVVSSEGTDLERSAAFRAYRADHSEAVPYLERPKQP